MLLKALWVMPAAMLLAACGSDQDRAAGAGASNDVSAGYASGKLATAETVLLEGETAPEPDVSGTKRIVAGAKLGRDVGPEGAIRDTQTTEQFAAGDPIHVALQVVHTPPPNTPVRVAWYGPDDQLMAEATKQISAADRYVNFSTESNPAWNAGEYRAEIYVNDEKVDEQHFAVIVDRKPATTEQGTGG